MLGRRKIRQALLVVGVVGAALAALSVQATAASDGAETSVPHGAGGIVRPRIVNGEPTSAYPATGALLLYNDTAASSLYGLCTGTLIGCRTFLTAAHCLCPDNVDDAATCERQGKADPRTLRVFLQQGGIFPVSAVAINPEYSFAQRGDVAVVTLGAPVTGVAPSTLNTTGKPAPGTVGTIVGFGTTIDGPRSVNDSGVKREGAITTAHCPVDIPDAFHVCWEFLGSDSNVCSGDSGGPLFLDFGAGPVIAGVTSGGSSFNCLAPDVGFDSDVFVNRAWIMAAAGEDLGTASCGIEAVGTVATTSFTRAGQLTSATPHVRLQVEVPAGTALLRIGLDGQQGSGSGFTSVANDFDLYVRAGAAPTTAAFDCADTGSTPFAYCELAAPAAGTWHVLVQLDRGAGEFQLTATTFAAAPSAACTGDCNGDGAVTIDEVLTAVNIVLGEASIATCPSFATGDGLVTVDQLVAAVSYALSACPLS